MNKSKDNKNRKEKQTNFQATILKMKKKKIILTGVGLLKKKKKEAKFHLTILQFIN